MNKKAYELSEENKIQLPMNEYGRPDRGIAIHELKNLPFTKEQIDNAINLATQVSEQKKLEVKEYDLHDDYKQEIINTYAGEVFLKTLNFDIVFNEKLNVEQAILPQVSIVGYGYFDNGQQNQKRTEYEVEINHRLIDLAQIIVKEHYGIVKVSNFEELNQATKAAKPSKLLEKVQQMRGDIQSSDFKNKM